MNDVMFYITSILLGAGLAMDAFSVSMANGLNEPKMKKRKEVGIAFTFSFFQFIMPLTGWFLVHKIATKFEAFQKYIPWIALILLLYIGGKMLIEGIKGNDENEEIKSLSFGTLIIQGIATSIDALSVGFTISDYNFIMALICSAIIMVVTFILCYIGIYIGKKFGMKLSGKATIIGGIILILIGLEIFIKGVF